VGAFLLQFISGSLLKIKMDLSKEEIIVGNPSYQALIHPYSDQEKVKTKIRCYSIYELFAEKLRALSAHAQKISMI
jgi:predicted nucleotidyltransferase component of viral defense system